MKKDRILPINTYIYAYRMLLVICSIMSSWIWIIIPFLSYPPKSNEFISLCFLIVLIIALPYSSCLYYFLAPSCKSKYIKKIDDEFVMYQLKKGNQIEVYRFKIGSQFFVIGSSKWYNKIQIIDDKGNKHIEKVDNDFFSRYEIPKQLIVWKRFID